MAINICIECGKEFNSKKIDASFCSAHCIMKNRWKKPSYRKLKLMQMEQIWEKTIRKWKGKTHPRYGIKLSNKQIEEMSNRAKGKCVNNKEHYKMMSKLMSGDNNPSKRKEVREKISKSKKGKPNLFNRGKNFEELYGKEKANIIKEKISKGHMGEKSHCWLGGKSFEKYTKEFNKQFKRAIRKRDNQICMLCGIHREKLKRALSIHHINYDKKLSIPKNCISLCDNCHAKTNYNRKHLIKFFQDLLSERYGYEYDNETILINLDKYKQGDLK